MPSFYLHETYRNIHLSAEVPTTLLISPSTKKEQYEPLLSKRVQAFHEKQAGRWHPQASYETVLLTVARRQGLPAVLLRGICLRGGDDIAHGRERRRGKSAPVRCNYRQHDDDNCFIRGLYFFRKNKSGTIASARLMLSGCIVIFFVPPGE